MEVSICSRPHVSGHNTSNRIDAEFRSFPGRPTALVWEAGMTAEGWIDIAAASWGDDMTLK